MSAHNIHRSPTGSMARMMGAEPEPQYRFACVECEDEVYSATAMEELLTVCSEPDCMTARVAKLLEENKQMRAKLHTLGLLVSTDLGNLRDQILEKCCTHSEERTAA